MFAGFRGTHPYSRLYFFGPQSSFEDEFTPQRSFWVVVALAELQRMSYLHRVARFS